MFIGLWSAICLGLFVAVILIARMSMCMNTPECRAERVYEQKARWAEDQRRFDARMAELARNPAKEG